MFWERNFRFWCRNYKFCGSNEILIFEMETKFQKIQNFVIVSKIQKFVITPEMQNFVIASKMQNFVIASKIQNLVTSQKFKKIKILLRNDKIASKKTKIVPKTKIPVQKYKMQNFVFKRAKQTTKISLLKTNVAKFRF